METKAIATVTLEIEMSTYGDNWTIEEIVKQVQKEAPQKIARMCEAAKVTVKGVPVVRVVSNII